MSVDYEWCIETNGFGSEVLFRDKLSLFKAHETEHLEQGLGELVLVRTADDWDQTRSWAYVKPEDGLPSHFETAHGSQATKVPVKYQKEFAAWKVAWRKPPTAVGGCNGT
jgi:hypothetical protein